jgi:cyanophycinase-like exopeptidase
MGSGETSPTMVTPHQKILANVPVDMHSAVFLDTPFGFQENADDLSARISDFFKNSVGRDIQLVTMRSDTQSEATVARAISAIKQAKWLFAGPGSPTYALSTWQNTGLAEHVGDVLTRGSAVFASAAALTLGSYTVPVYEIYKVGQNPFWLSGLNILEKYTGLKAAVIPHFDNTEGANHDTRFCYLGETRLALLEQLLPADTFILGIDEHTGVSFDIDEKTATVFGRGVLTLRKGDNSRTFKSGSVITWDEIAAAVAVPRSTTTASNNESSIAMVSALLDSGKVPEAVSALLELDTPERDQSLRREIHAVVLQIGELAATPKVDLDQIISPFVEMLLQLRQSARSEGRWADADLIRDSLLTQNIAIKDSSDTTNWELLN